MHRSWLVALFVTVTPWALPSCQEEPPPPPPQPASTATATATAATTATATAATTASAAASGSADASAAAPPLVLPAVLAGKAELVPKGDPTEASTLAPAVKPDGQGGLKQGILVRITADVPVWRMWNGPAKKDAQGHTNRLGHWWSYDAPHGTQTEYRTDYEICMTWNDLTYVAKCTLKKGAVVAVGPGQSVSAKTCGDPAGQESYPADTRDWQVYVDDAFSPKSPVVCPPDAQDYAADLTDLSHPKKAGGARATAR
jgi:hypothetical protein